jgi:hypothetical protein
MTANVTDNREAAANDPIEKRTAAGERLDLGTKASAPSGRGQPGDVAPGIEDLRARLDQFVANSRKELRDRVPAAGEQDVQMTLLRESFSRERRLWKAVTLDDRHAIEVVRQHATGEQPGYAAADDDGMRALSSLQSHC